MNAQTGILEQASSTFNVNSEKGFSQIGTKMDDGTVYAGISPVTGEGLYVAPQPSPEPGYFKWQEAMEYAEELDAHNYSDWRLPTKEEFRVLKTNQYKGALKDLFDKKGNYPTGHYWSSDENFHRDSAYVQKFGDYGSGDFSKACSGYVRAVRTGPALPNLPELPTATTIAP